LYVLTNAGHATVVPSRILHSPEGDHVKQPKRAHA
jgi:hypothetical protein